MKQKVLVVGATSTVGEHVVDQLAQAGQLAVVAGVRNEAKGQPFRAKGIATVELDLADVDSIRRAVQGVDRIFLLTGYTVEMLNQSKMIVDQAERAGVRHIVHMGAWAPDDTDLAHFGWHQFVERYIEGSKLSWTHLAPGMFMQNMLGGGSLWGSFASSGVAGSRPLHAFTGAGRLGWIAAEDIARVAVASLHEPGMHAGKKYNLSVEVRSVAEIAAILSGTLGQPYHAQIHSPEDFYQALLTSGMEPNYAACARETLLRFGHSAIPGQEGMFPFQEIVGVPPISWAAFARLHSGEFLTLGDTAE